MAKTQLSEEVYLVFKKKEIHFEVPDDFPEEKIPKFSNLDDFNAWYKKQNFKPYEVTLTDGDHLIDFPHETSDLNLIKN